MMLQYMLNLINDTKAPKTKTNITMQLVKGDKGWLIDANEELANALTGNFYEVSKQLNGK